ncbi:bacteriophage protein [Pectobacterium carotovorum subsp. carotovorum]|nr:bacteriophage protein [Pectobacterium carotovorum subsp. carotovorum]
MRHIIRGKLTPAEREAAIEALNSHQRRYGNYAKPKTSSTYRVKIDGRIVPVEIVNRNASYVATVMNGHPSLQKMCGVPA